MPKNNENELLEDVSTESDFQNEVTPSDNIIEDSLEVENYNNENINSEDEDAGNALKFENFFSPEEIEKATKNAIDNGLIKSRKDVRADARRKKEEKDKRNEEKRRILSVRSQVQSAKRSGTILEATILGVSEVKTPAGNKVFVFANYENAVKVMIPFEELYRKNPLDLNMGDINNSAEYLKRQKIFAEKLIGLTIPFLVKGWSDDEDDEEFAAYGSRSDALKIIEKSNYDPRSDGSVVIKVGSLVDAKITAVSKWSIAVNVGGIDTTLSVRNLTYRFVNDSMDINRMYHVGETISVEVIRITIDENGDRSIVVSAKRGELADVRRKQRYLMPSIGERCLGVITAITTPTKSPSKSIVILLFIEGYNMPAVSGGLGISSLGYIPKLGDKVRVTVTGISDNGVVYVKCRQIIPQS